MEIEGQEASNHLYNQVVRKDSSYMLNASDDTWRDGALFSRPITKRRMQREPQ